MHLPGLPNPESLLHAAPDKARRCSATTFPLLMLVSVLFVLFWGTDYPRPLSLSFRRPAPATTRSMSSHRPLTQARIRALTPRSPTRAPFTISGSVSQPHATGRRTPVVPRVDAAATPSGIPIAAFVARVSGLSLGVLALWSWYQRRRPRKACPRARSTRAFACAAATAEDGGTRASKATGRVLVVGATGGCGRAAYHACLAQGFQDVRCLVRSRERGRSVLGDQAALVVGDATELHTLQAAMQGVTHVIICLGRRRKEAGSSAQSIDYQGTVNVLTASQAAGSVQRIVYVTSTSVDSPKKPFIRVLNLLGGMGLGWKLRAEQALRDSGIPYVVVRPVALKVCTLLRSSRAFVNRLRVLHPQQTRCPSAALCARGWVAFHVVRPRVRRGL